jgi:hypothetical protein
MSIRLVLPIALVLAVAAPAAAAQRRPAAAPVSLRRGRADHRPQQN